MKLRIRYLLTMRYKIAGLWAFVSSFDFRPTLLGISEWMGSSAVLCYLYGTNTTHCLVLGQNAKGASCRKVHDWWIVVQAAICPWRGGSVGCWRGQQEGERTGQQQQRHLCHNCHAHFQHTGESLPLPPNNLIFYFESRGGYKSSPFLIVRVSYVLKGIVPEDEKVFWRSIILSMKPCFADFFSVKELGFFTYSLVSISNKY